MLLFLALLARPLPLPLPRSAPQPPVGEVITVERIVINLRVTDVQGAPILGLVPADFDVTIGGRPVEVMSATWVAETAEGRAMTGEPEVNLEYLDALAAGNSVAPDEGRLFIFLVQTDFGRATPRLRGQMKFLPFARQILQALPRRDRVAVLSFDSHLRFRLDFTTDRAAAIRAIEESIGIEEPPWPPVVPEPSLAACLDREAMRRATSEEQALVQIARAAAEIPGHKQLIFCGYGLGERFRGGRVYMKAEWEEAKRQLIDAGITINSIYTNEGRGQLVVGVKEAARQTGGFFVSTANFPQQVVQRFSGGELAGHYELELRPPADLGSGTHQVELRVRKGGLDFHTTVTLSEQ